MFPARHADLQVTLIKAQSPRDLDTFLNIMRSVQSRINRPITNRHDAVAVIRSGTTFMIQDGDEAVGALVCSEIAPNRFYLSEFAICPSAQGQGIGKRALEKMLSECLTVGCECSLHTHPENTPARKLYESMGFVVREEIPDFFGDGEPRLLLSKSLTLAA